MTTAQLKPVTLRARVARCDPDLEDNRPCQLEPLDGGPAHLVKDNALGREAAALTGTAVLARGAVETIDGRPVITLRSYEPLDAALEGRQSLGGREPIPRRREDKV